MVESVVPSVVSAAHRRMFVISESYNGFLGGVDTTDAKCQCLASNAGLTGSWQTLLSTALEDARSRLVISGSIFSMAGKKLADNSATFWNGSRDAAMDFDETSTQLSVPAHVVDVFGHVIASSASDFWDGSLSYASGIALNELGGAVANSTHVWTGLASQIMATPEAPHPMPAHPAGNLARLAVRGSNALTPKRFREMPSGRQTSAKPAEARGEGGPL